MNPPNRSGGADGWALPSQPEVFPRNLSQRVEHEQIKTTKQCKLDHYQRPPNRARGTHQPYYSRSDEHSNQRGGSDQGPEVPVGHSAGQGSADGYAEQHGGGCAQGAKPWDEEIIAEPGQRHRSD